MKFELFPFMRKWDSLWAFSHLLVVSDSQVCIDITVAALTNILVCQDVDRSCVAFAWSSGSALFC